MAHPLSLYNIEFMKNLSNTNIIYNRISYYLFFYILSLKTSIFAIVNINTINLKQFQTKVYNISSLRNIPYYINKEISSKVLLYVKYSKQYKILSALLLISINFISYKLLFNKIIITLPLF